MALKAKIGAYTFDRCSSFTFSDTKVGSVRTRQIEMTCHIDRTGWSAINTEKGVMEAALAISSWPLDVQLVDDGSPTVIFEIDKDDASIFPGEPIIDLNYPVQAGDGSLLDTLQVEISAVARFHITTSATIFYTESMTLEEQITNQAVREVLGAATNPSFQPTTLSPARFVQEGSALALAAYPSHPSYGGPASGATKMRPDKKTKRGPKRASSGDLVEFGISWSYERFYTSTPIFSDPGTQPA